MITLFIALLSPMFELAENSKLGSLATLYKDTPFVSLVPYALDHQGRPVIFISDLAIHTKNISKNPKCSLMLSKQDNDDLFNSPRITYIGKMERVPDDDVDLVKKAYLAKYPDVESLLDLEDFAFYRLDIKSIYYIGGFGDINWIDLDEYIQHWTK